MNSAKIITKEWKKVRLGDVCDFINGKTPLRSKSEYWENGSISWFTVDDIRTQGRIITKTNQLISEIGLKESGLKIVPKDTLLLCCTASIGEYAFTKIELTTNQQFNALVTKDKNKLSPYYLYAIAPILKKQLENIMGTTTFGFVSLGKLSLIEIFLPSLNEQNKIAEILSIVDEEIEKIDQKIKKTEELKRGLMAELLTKGIGHKKFKKTKLGEIPGEWEVVKLEEIAQVERGKFSNRPRNDPKFYGGEYPFIQTGDVVNSNGRIQKYNQTLNEEGLAISKIFKKGTVVITIAANIGDTGILEFDCCFPDSLVGIIVKENMNNIFLEYYLRTRKDYLNSIATQSAQKNINLEKLRPLLIIKPKIEEQRQIAEILSAIDDKINIYKQIKNKLAELKRGLMQDLLSGKKRV